MTWLQNAAGRPVELARPVVEEVDFAVMAQSLAQLNRYTGHAAKPVSVGLHLLIGLDLAPAPVKPWWLLHDSHEERLGDQATPYKAAVEEVAREIGGDQAAYLVARVRDEMEARHDRVIHEAAGLPLPSPPIRAAIKAVDLAALATERRDFLVRSVRPWDTAVEAAIPSRRVWKWMPPDRVADALLAAFRATLPALAGRASDRRTA